MTVSQEFLIEVMLWVGGVTISVISVLIWVVWTQLTRQLDILHRRTLTLGHEDREIRSHIQTLMISMLEQRGNDPLSLAEENRRLLRLLDEYKRHYPAGDDPADEDVA